MLSHRQFAVQDHAKIADGLKCFMTTELRFRLMSSCMSFIRLDRKPNHVNLALSRLGCIRRDDLSEVFDTELKSPGMPRHNFETDMHK